jgi:crotonobetainyl-CoA:carnitine CoA-transferase CaiB-like acyl-CoA transferase
MGRPELADDPRFRDSDARRRHADEVDGMLADWIGQRNLADVLTRFEEVEAPIAPIYSVAQIHNDPHYRARQSFIEVADDDLGTVTMQNVIPRLSRTPGRIAHTGRSAIGADTSSVLGELKSSNDEVRP